MQILPVYIVTVKKKEPKHKKKNSICCTKFQGLKISTRTMKIGIQQIKMNSQQTSAMDTTNYSLCNYSSLPLQVPWTHNKILVTVTQSITNVPQTNNTSTSGMDEEQCEQQEIIRAQFLTLSCLQQYQISPKSEDFCILALILDSKWLPQQTKMVAIWCSMSYSL